MTGWPVRGLHGWRLPTTAVCLAVIGCLVAVTNLAIAGGGQAHKDAPDRKTAQLKQLPLSGPLVGKTLPGESARDWLGRTISFSQYRGRPLALWFANSATCGYCVLEAQAYGALSKQLEAMGVQVAGVNLHEAQRDVLEYLKRARWEGTVLVEPAALEPGGRDLRLDR